MLPNLRPNADRFPPVLCAFSPSLCRFRLGQNQSQTTNARISGRDLSIEQTAGRNNGTRVLRPAWADTDTSVRRHFVGKKS